jgi:DNA-binding CsgD family transcriptional regulator
MEPSSSWSASTSPAGGTHVSALYRGSAERDRLLVDFVEEGLRVGNTCLCLIDRTEPEEVLTKVARAAGAPPGETPARLDVDRADEVCLESGRLSGERILAFLSATADSAARTAFPVLRAAGDMSWVIPTGNTEGDLDDDYFAYESAVGTVVAEKSSVFMCMYDLERFTASRLVDVLKTHSRVLLDGVVLDNRHCLAPDRHLARRRDRRPTQHSPALAPDSPPGSGWQSLTNAERRVCDMVATGMTNKVIAEHLTVSPHTVDAHLKHSYTKLDIHSRVELTVLTMERRRATHSIVAGAVR